MAGDPGPPARPSVAGAKAGDPPALKRPKLEEEDYSHRPSPANGSAPRPSSSASTSSASDVPPPDEPGDDMGEEAVRALIAHRERVVEQCKLKLAHYQSQLETTENELAVARSRYRDRAPPIRNLPPPPPDRRTPPPIQRDPKPSQPTQKAPAPQTRPQLVIPGTNTRPAPRAPVPRTEPAPRRGSDEVHRSSRTIWSIRTVRVVFLEPTRRKNDKYAHN